MNFLVLFSSLPSPQARGTCWGDGLVSSECEAADLEHRHKAGLSIRLATKISRSSFQGGSFKSRDALEDALLFKKMPRLVPCGHICQHCAFKEQEPRTPGVAHWCPHRQAPQRGHRRTYIPKVCTARLVQKRSLCPGWLGRAGMLASRGGSGAGIGTEATGRASLLLAAGAHCSVTLPLYSSTGQAQTSIQKTKKKKKSLFLNIATTFMAI